MAPQDDGLEEVRRSRQSFRRYEKKYGVDPFGPKRGRRVEGYEKPYREKKVTPPVSAPKDMGKARSRKKRAIARKARESLPLPAEGVQEPLPPPPEGWTPPANIPPPIVQPKRKPAPPKEQKPLLPPEETLKTAVENGTRIPWARFGGHYSDKNLGNTTYRKKLVTKVLSKHKGLISKNPALTRAYYWPYDPAYYVKEGRHVPWSWIEEGGGKVYAPNQKKRILAGQPPGLAGRKPKKEKVVAEKFDYGKGKRTQKQIDAYKARSARSKKLLGYGGFDAAYDAWSKEERVAWAKLFGDSYRKLSPEEKKKFRSKKKAEFIEKWNKAN